MHRIYLEQGKKRVFACSLDWPGWCRVDKTDKLAIARLVDYTDRYRIIAERAGVDFNPGEPTVVATIDGGATTDFGAPEKQAPTDLEPVPKELAERDVKLMRAAWEVFDEVAAASPEELRKGPRGGGRDRTKIVEHVTEAERNYARHVGIRHRPYKSEADRDAMREELARVYEKEGEFKWAPRYAVRRVVWHVIDHLWEMQDRRE
ncbi:MAG: hypothetical protein HOV86_27610 [Thermoactinospora sp.]|nr:hypothetical protein [Thermoactinospora sp.]